MAPSQILLLGRSGSGKTQFTNAVTGSKFAIGSAMAAKTLKVQSGKFVRNPNYLIVDTPGFNDYAEVLSNDATVQIPTELTKSVIDWCKARNSNSGELRAIIFFYDLSQPRFIQVDLYNVKVMKKIVDRFGVNTIFVVTTKGDSEAVTESHREERERELNEMIKQYMKRELPIISCGKDQQHAIDVVQRVIDSLSSASSNPAAPTPYLTLPTHAFPPSASTLATNTETGENMPSRMPQSNQKPGLGKRILKFIVPGRR